MQALEAALIELAAKYEAGRVDAVTPLKDGWRIDCDKGRFHFFYDFTRDDPGKEDGTPVPLYRWRRKRRFLEMAGLIASGTVAPPALALRVKNIRPAEALGGGMLAVLLRELDLLEFLLGGDRISRLFSVPDARHPYVNTLAATEAGVKASMELGLSPSPHGAVEMHEIVLRGGIVTDVDVDTQTEQYPIYVYGKRGITTYADTDFELYGMDGDLADCVRFMLWALANEGCIPALWEDYARQRSLALRAMKGGMQP